MSLSFASQLRWSSSVGQARGTPEVCRRGPQWSKRVFSLASPRMCTSAGHGSAEQTNAAAEKFEGTVQLCNSIEEIGPTVWDELLSGADPRGSPFMEYSWLHCLERSGCVGGESGWRPIYLALRSGDEILAAVPLYAKGHSMGEFVFDQSWAEAAYAAGISYYPKLTVAVPFTPAVGRRVLTRVGKDRGSLLGTIASTLRGLCRQLRVSSVHVNFCDPDERDAFQKGGFLRRDGVQFHFENCKPDKTGPYHDFDDYLSQFKSKRRIKLKRERRSVYEDAGVSVEVLTGEDLTPDVLDEMFLIYQSTIEKMYIYGRQYLNEEFFRLLGHSDFRRNLCYIRASRDGQTIAGTVNVTKGERFYGRYWGAFEEVRNLHFEVCYYRAIDYCIEKGLRFMEPGAGGGDFKFVRGFEPVVTSSLHYFEDQRMHNAVREFVNSEALGVGDMVEEMQASSAIRSKQPPLELEK